MRSRIDIVSIAHTDNRTLRYRRIACKCCIRRKVTGRIERRRFYPCPYPCPCLALVSSHQKAPKWGPGIFSSKVTCLRTIGFCCVGDEILRIWYHWDFLVVYRSRGLDHHRRNLVGSASSPLVTTCILTALTSLHHAATWVMHQTHGRNGRGATSVKRRQVVNFSRDPIHYARGDTFTDHPISSTSLFDMATKRKRTIVKQEPPASPPAASNAEAAQLPNDNQVRKK